MIHRELERQQDRFFFSSAVCVCVCISSISPLSHITAVIIVSLRVGETSCCSWMNGDWEQQWAAAAARSRSMPSIHHLCVWVRVWGKFLPFFLVSVCVSEWVSAGSNPLCVKSFHLTPGDCEVYFQIVSRKTPLLLWFLLKWRFNSQTHWFSAELMIWFHCGHTTVLDSFISALILQLDSVLRLIV